jgi:hypothetical protein
MYQKSVCPKGNVLKGKGPKKSVSLKLFFLSRRIIKTKFM